MQFITFTFHFVELVIAKQNVLIDTLYSNSQPELKKNDRV